MSSLIFPCEPSSYCIAPDQRYGRKDARNAHMLAKSHPTYTEQGEDKILACHSDSAAYEDVSDRLYYASFSWLHGKSFA